MFFPFGPCRAGFSLHGEQQEGLQRHASCMKVVLSKNTHRQDYINSVAQLEHARFQDHNDRPNTVCCRAKSVVITKIVDFLRLKPFLFWPHNV